MPPKKTSSKSKSKSVKRSTSKGKGKGKSSKSRSNTTTKKGSRKGPCRGKRCEFIRDNGERCKRKANEDYMCKYCTQHQNALASGTTKSKEKPIFGPFWPSKSDRTLRKKAKAGTYSDEEDEDEFEEETSSEEDEY